MKALYLVVCLGGMLSSGWSADLKKARFTEVIRDVKVTSSQNTEVVPIIQARG